MYTIKLDVNDTIYDKVMFFLKNIPVTNLEVKKDDIVSFFHNSPLVDSIELKRKDEIYKDRVFL